MQPTGAGILQKAASEPALHKGSGGQKGKGMKSKGPTARQTSGAHVAATTPEMQPPVGTPPPPDQNAARATEEANWQVLPTKPNSGLMPPPPGLALQDDKSPPSPRLSSDSATKESESNLDDLKGEGNSKGTGEGNGRSYGNVDVIDKNKNSCKWPSSKDAKSKWLKDVVIQTLMQAAKVKLQMANNLKQADNNVLQLSAELRLATKIMKDAGDALDAAEKATC